MKRFRVTLKTKAKKSRSWVVRSQNESTALQWAYKVVNVIGWRLSDTQISLALEEAE